jgi:hypothetical protein
VVEWSWLQRRIIKGRAKVISQKNACLVTATVLVMFSADLAEAQQKIEEAGMDIVVRDYQVSVLEKGHVVVIPNETGVTVTDDPSNPLHMTSVDCTGMFEEFSDGTYKGNGYCTNTDKDGDKLISRWTASSDMEENRYEVAGGTGKFEGAKGEGTATIIEVSPGPQGRQIARWQGTAEYPNIRK